MRLIRYYIQILTYDLELSCSKARCMLYSTQFTGETEIYFYRRRSVLEVDIFHAAERVTGKSIIAVEAERYPGDPPIVGGSSDKARRILNSQPGYPGLDEIIKTVWLPQSAGIGKEAGFRSGRGSTSRLPCRPVRILALPRPGSGKSPAPWRLRRRSARPKRRS
jgi:hypothetical protein